MNNIKYLTAMICAAGLLMAGNQAQAQVVGTPYLVPMGAALLDDAGKIYYFNCSVPADTIYSAIEDTTATTFAAQQINGTLPSGGVAPYSYQWQYQLIGSTTWTAVPAGGTSQNYTPGAEFADSILYRRRVTDGAGAVGYTNFTQAFVAPTNESLGLRGKDFFLAFGSNINSPSNQVRIVNPNASAASVTLTFKNLASLNTTLTVPANSVYTHTLSVNQYNAVLQGSASKANNKSLNITSNVPISVFALNTANVSTDATAVYPVGTLGTDYYNLSYISPTTTYYSQIIVIATEDNTNVYQNTLGGTLLTTLNTGQVYVTQAAATERSGLHYISDKPIAYFISVGLALVPSTHNSGDILFEQLQSVDKWGTHFLVPQTEQTKTRIRVLASQDGTVIDGTGFTIPSTVPTGSANSLNLNAGKWVELDCTVAEGAYIYSNHPVMVCSYMVGNDYTTAANDGDPAQSWVAPIEQKSRRISVSRFYASTSAINKHFALLITKTSGKASTTVSIGGGAATAVSGVTWHDNAASGLSFCSYTLPDNNFYTFDNPNGLVIQGYGYGPYESYSYLAGAASRNMTAPLLVNDSYSDEMAGETYDDCNAITFECDASETPTSVAWKINGAVRAAQANQTTWSDTFSVGDYLVEMTAVVDGQTITERTWFRVRCCTP
jgi:hypothetical protein